MVWVHDIVYPNILHYTLCIYMHVGYLHFTRTKKNLGYIKIMSVLTTGVCYIIEVRNCVVLFLHIMAGPLTVLLLIICVL